MHSLVQLVTHRRLKSRGKLRRHAEDFAAQLDLVFPSASHEKQSLRETTFPLAKSGFEFMPVSGTGTLQWVSVIPKAAGYVSTKGGSQLWTHAVEMAERCRETRKSKLGEEHPHVFASRSKLTRYYRASETAEKRRRWKNGTERRDETNSETAIPTRSHR